jgi:diguanylate cyclase (GGDEF)-like protein
MGLLSRSGDIEAALGEARARIAELESELAQRSSHDPLTAEMLTPAAFRAQLELDVQRAERYRRPLSVLLLDIDGFRSINLEHGLGTGDAVLLAVAKSIGGQTRAHDLACRMGGDEFVVLLPETGSEGALGAAERIVVGLEAVQTGPVRGVRVSVGIAALRTGQRPEQLLAAAQRALEQARAAGGGRTALSAGEGEELTPDPTHGEVVAALASALQERDRYTGDHSESVVDVAGRVGEALAMPEEEIARLRTAALLHDIGKVGVPDEILHKPGSLDPAEWEVMRQHPVIGERILRAIPGLGRVARIVRHEHERWDGQGYPDGLSGEDIPLASRVILACDAYHAMTSERPYRQAMAHSDAIAELNANAGSQFDPTVAEALVGYLCGRRRSGTAGL